MESLSKSLEDTVSGASRQQLFLGFSNYSYRFKRENDFLFLPTQVNFTISSGPLIAFLSNHFAVIPFNLPSVSVQDSSHMKCSLSFNEHR